jgi:hypothetical protein
VTHNEGQHRGRQAELNLNKLGWQTEFRFWFRPYF